jgi:outer membrane protein OmpA-like peptidoglycan-associated protein
MRLSGLKLFCAALGVVLLPTLASAQEPYLPIEINVLQMVNLPQQSPRLTITAQDAVRNLRVVVREGGRSVASRSIGQLGSGGSRVFNWRAQPGVHEYVIEVTGRTSTGQARVSSEMVVTVMRPLEIFLRKDQVDLETRRIHFSINNPAGRVELTIYNAAGRTLHEADIDLSGHAPGSRLEVSWPALAEPIGRMTLRVFDVSESWAGVELTPFAVEIPHAEVVFETAKWVIRKSERPKLDEAYERILHAIREHGADLKARLYILGHTDTVGSNEDNMVLSRNRANSIARYFKERGGITLPILACGFGETRLAVTTADNVDEPRNRRAQYILAASTPVHGNWITVSPGTVK